MLKKSQFFFIFLEIASRGDQLKFLEEYGRVTELQTLVWATQMLSALMYLNVRLKLEKMNPQIE